jgi:ABC-type transporter Mla MlaB component
MIYNLSFS